MQNGFSFPSGLIYIGIVIAMVIIIVVQAMKNANQKHELEYLLSRRDRKSAEPKQQAPAPCPNECEIFCNYRDTVIPDLEAAVTHWKTKYQSAEVRCAIAQNTICKLRTAKEGKDVQSD